MHLPRDEFEGDVLHDWIAEKGFAESAYLQYCHVLSHFVVKGGRVNEKG
jgi:hypothetical protein